MAITRENLRQTVIDIKKYWLDDWFEENLDNILDSGEVDFENSPNNNEPAYPILAAILERCFERCIYGASYESEIRKARKLKNKYKFLVIK